ncbi:MAG: DUF975 family protein [Cellulosilyticaceae bacterium]
MLNRKIAKDSAKEKLKGQWTKVGLIIALIVVVLTLVTVIPIVGLIALIVFAGAVTLTQTIISLKVADGENIQLEDAKAGFKDLVRSMGMFWWIYLWVMLWSLLLIIPGIIAMYKYKFAYYILAENPNITVREALNESKRLTYGHKWDLFVTDLSFLGWAILSLITFDIGNIWLIPYEIVTQAELYRQLV